MKKTRKTDSSKIPKIRIPDKAFWLYLQRQLFKSIGLIGLILAIVGSYQIYAPIQPNPLKLLSNIGYSVIKLFIFVPTYSMEKRLWRMNSQSGLHQSVRFSASSKSSAAHSIG